MLSDFGDDENRTAPSDGKAGSGSLAGDSTSPTTFDRYPSPNLCEHCQMLCRDSEGVSSISGNFMGSRHWKTFLELEKSADEGCTLCAQFVLGFEYLGRQNLRLSSGSETITCRGPWFSFKGDVVTKDICMSITYSSANIFRVGERVSSFVTLISCDPRCNHPSPSG